VSRARRSVVLSIVLGVLLVGGVVLSAMLGQLAISPGEVIGSVLRALGIHTSAAPDAGTQPGTIAESTLWVVRFPRIAMGLAVGAALAVAGAVMQAIFGDPLAEPGVVGVSSGAALGAALAIVLGVTALGSGTLAIRVERVYGLPVQLHLVAGRPVVVPLRPETPAKRGPT
jgi:iron complex transport system permease protein